MQYVPELEKAIETHDLPLVAQLIISTSRTLFRASSGRPGRNVLIRACQYGTLPILQLLLEKALWDYDLNAETHEYGDQPTPLYAAAANGQESITRFLLEKHALADFPIDNPPLIVAAKKGHTGVVRILLEEGNADVNIGTFQGQTALWHAANAGEASVVKYLLTRPHILVDAYDTAEQMTPLYVASETGCTEVVRLLLTEGHADVTKAEKLDGATPLYIASQNGHAEIVDMLLNDPNTQVNRPLESDGTTPIYIGSHYGCTEVVKLLLEKGHANPNFPKTTDRATPLYTASVCGYTSVVDVLLDGGADPNQEIQGGTVPLHAASLRGLIKVVEALTKRGAHLNPKRTSDGATPLYLACRAGRVDIVKYLVQAGADVNIPIFNGTTPLNVVLSDKSKPKCIKGHDLIAIVNLERWIKLRPSSTGYVCLICGHVNNGWPVLCCPDCLLAVCPICKPGWTSTSDNHLAIAEILRSAGAEEVLDQK